MFRDKQERTQELSKSQGGQAVQRASARSVSPFNEMAQMMDSMRRHWLAPWRMEWPDLAALETRIPAVDVMDQADQIVVKAQVPGVNKEDLDVSVTANTVTIRGTTRREEEKEEGEYYRREISSGTFSRTVALPADVDDSRAKASFKDGILQLVLPKLETAKRRTIKVE